MHYFYSTVYFSIVQAITVKEESDGSIKVVNESGKFIIINEDEKAHKSNERPIRYICTLSKSFIRVI
jgi:hypothetical protein